MRMRIASAGDAVLGAPVLPKTLVCISCTIAGSLYTRRAMSKASDLDPKAVRRQFARRTQRLVGPDFLLREIERRMLERLELVRLEPALLVDAGCGLGQGAMLLQQRYPAARVLGVDVSEPMAAAAAALHGDQARRSMFDRLRTLFGAAQPGSKAPLFAAADAASLPLATGSVDLIWSNLVWHWFADHGALLQEWRRVARSGCLLMFSAFGVDSLRELRSIGIDTPQFDDMHDIGDWLVAAGFAEPVMDAERMTVTWESPQSLLSELHALGGNARRSRGKGMHGRHFLRSRLDRLAALAGPDGRIALSVEIVYGHAWAPAQRPLPPGVAPVRFDMGSGREKS
jgi:malonyl-CoA O-methyltransferase